MATTSPLRQRMIEDMTIRNLSVATQQSYIYAVRKFSRHFGRSPDRLGIEDVRAFQLHLIAQKRSWSHINQTACALRFFYGARQSGPVDRARTRRHRLEPGTLCAALALHHRAADRRGRCWSPLQGKRRARRQEELNIFILWLTRTVEKGSCSS